MTSTEIIIRIKKARKKWKLVVPKKRIASYRTNRWFAKPRWIEIELTYTQASKLRLVEPKEVTRAMSAEQQVASHATVESERTRPGGSASEPEPDNASTCPTILGLDPSIDQPGQLLGADDVDFASDDHHLEDETVLSGLLPHGDRVPLLQQLPTADTDVCSRQSTSAVAAARPRTDRAAPRASAFLLIASSASVLASVAAAWITFANTPMTADTACKRFEQLAPCSQMIVTGSISEVDQPERPEPRSATTLATHASSEPISAIELPQLDAPHIPKSATAPAAREDDLGKIGNRADDGNEQPRQASTAVESDPLPTATTPNNSLPLPQNVSADHHDCRELRAAGRSINIQFDYASSSLNQATSSYPRGLCSEAAVLSVGQGDYRGSHRFRWTCRLEPVAFGSSGQSGASASCPCRRATRSVVGDWIWAIPPFRTQCVDQEQAQQQTRLVGCRPASLSYVQAPAR